METAAAKHYKFINSKTSNVIYYYTLKVSLSDDNVKVELEKIKAKVATDNSLPVDTIYWEEIKNEK